GRAEEDKRAVGATGAIAARVGGLAEEPAGRAAPNQRRTAGQSGVARASESGSRSQEPRSRRSALGDGREGRATGADFEIQIRVSRKHVARATHAAQQHAHSVATTCREWRRESFVETGAVRRNNSLIRFGFAFADQ